MGGIQTSVSIEFTGAFYLYGYMERKVPYDVLRPSL